MTKRYRRNQAIIIIAIVIVLVLAFGGLGLKRRAEIAKGDVDYRDDDTRPRGIRNNNPGNIKFKEGNNWKGKVPFDKNTDENKTFEQFTEYKWGVRAMILLLIIYMRNGYDTLDKIIRRYTSGDSKSSQDAYITYVSVSAGISPTKILTPTKTNLRELVIAMTHWENNTDAVSKAQFDAGYALVFE